ncbi:hypothetical protein [Agrobacterium sp. El2ro-1b]
MKNFLKIKHGQTEGEARGALAIIALTVIVITLAIILRGAFVV